MMKNHSYYMETFELRLKKETFVEIVQTLNRNENGSIDKQLESCAPKLHSLLYYWAAPTLIYQDEYPRNERTNWLHVTSYTIQIVIGMAVMYLITTGLVLPDVQHVGLVPFKMVNVAQTMMNMLTVGFIAFGLCFYMVWHLVHNLSGELLRFADRQYYHDWWTSTGLRGYYRKWNLIVKQWLFAYVFTTLHRRTGNRGLSSFAVMFISGVFHDYIMTTALGTFFPVFCLNLTVFGGKFRMEPLSSCS